MSLETADDLWRQQSVRFALDVLGRKSEANTEIARLEKKYGAQAGSISAEFYACRKDADHALLWLDHASRQQDFDPVSTNCFCMKNLDPGPRYKALLRKKNLPE